MGSKQGGQSVLNDIFYVIRLTIPHYMKIFPDIVLVIQHHKPMSFFFCAFE